MLTRTAIIGAVLLGMAVPSTAQKSKRGEGRTPARAERVAPRATQAPRYNAPRSTAPVTRVRERGHERGHGRGHERGHERGHGRGRGRGHNRGHNHSTQRYARVIPSPARRVHGRPVPVTSHHYHYETRRVWVPGRVRRVYVPACYEQRWDPYLGCYKRVCVHEAYYRTVQDPGCWEYRRVRVPGPQLHINRRGVHFHF